MNPPPPQPVGLMSSLFSWSSFPSATLLDMEIGPGHVCNTFHIMCQVSTLKILFAFNPCHMVWSTHVGTHPVIVLCIIVLNPLLLTHPSIGCIAQIYPNQSHDRKHGRDKKQHYVLILLVHHAALTLRLQSFSMMLVQHLKPPTEHSSLPVLVWIWHILYTCMVVICPKKQNYCLYIIFKKKDVGMPMDASP